MGGLDKIGEPRLPARLESESLTTGPTISQHMEHYLTPLIVRDPESLLLDVVIRVCRL